MNKEIRNEYTDILKGIGILSIVLGHICLYLSFNDIYVYYWLSI